MWLVQAGILTTIPVVMVVGPLIGYYLGYVLDRRWSSAPWGMTVGLILGLLASFREVLVLLKRAKALHEHHDQPNDST